MSNLYSPLVFLFLEKKKNARATRVHTQANQPVCQPVCRDFQNGRCFRGSCRFYHGATDDLAAAQMAAGGVLGYHGGHTGMHPVQPAHPAHPAHALQRVMSLPSGGLPPFPGAGIRGRSFDAASAADAESASEEATSVAPRARSASSPSDCPKLMSAWRSSGAQ